MKLAGQVQNKAPSTYRSEAESVREPAQAPVLQTQAHAAARRARVSSDRLAAADLRALQNALGNSAVQILVHAKRNAVSSDDKGSAAEGQVSKGSSPMRSLSRGVSSSAIVQRALSSRREVRGEIVRVTGVEDIPLPLITELLRRLTLRHRLLALRQRRNQLAARHIRCFPNGDCGFVDTTQSEYTTRDTRLIDQIQELQRQVLSSPREPLSLRNVRLGIADPMGRARSVEDAIILAETTYDFAEGEEFRTETRWEQRTGFPQLPQERPQSGLVYLFVAVTNPGDIAANNRAAAATAESVVRGNTAVFNASEDWARVEEVDSIDAFIGLFARINVMCQRRGWRVRQIEVFSHGGLDGPMFGARRLQFDFTGATENGARSLSSLSILPFTGDAVVFFRGCRIGSGSFLAAFAQLQGVATYGFAGATSFSNRPGAFYAWQQGQPAYQMDFPGSETVSKALGRHPEPTPPRGYVPVRTVVPVQRKTNAELGGTAASEQAAQTRIQQTEVSQTKALTVMRHNGHDVTGAQTTPTGARNVATWLAERLPTALEIVAQGWQMQAGADRGAGQLKVALRGGRVRSTLLRDFQREFSLRRRDLVNALSNLSVVFTIVNDTDYATLRSGDAAWRQGQWESARVGVDLLRRGGPVEVRAIVSNEGRAITTLTSTQYVLAPGVAREVAGRVLGYRSVVEEVSRELGLQPDLVMAIMSMESGGRPESGGTRGPYFGLMQARRMSRARGEAAQTFAARVHTYQRDIRQQIVDGVQVFLNKKRALERMGFVFNEPLLESDILTIEIAYAAGEGTVQVALRRARTAGRGDAWREREFLLPAIVETGAHHPPFAIRRGMVHWTPEQMQAELIVYCGLSEVDVATRFRRRDGSWNTGAMRAALAERANQRRVELKEWIRTQEAIALPEIEAQDRWVYRSAQLKYENLTGTYMDRLMGYRRYYEAVMTRHWVEPVSVRYEMEEEVITVGPHEVATPPAAVTPEAEMQ